MRGSDLCRRCGERPLDWRLLFVAGSPLMRALGVFSSVSSEKAALCILPQTFSSKLLLVE